MKMILVRGYKDSKISWNPRENEEVLRGCHRIPVESANNSYVLDDATAAIEEALKVEGFTQNDIISITCVPYQTNGRDIGSNDYYVAVRTSA